MAIKRVSLDAFGLPMTGKRRTLLHRVLNHVNNVMLRRYFDNVAEQAYFNTLISEYPDMEAFLRVALGLCNERDYAVGKACKEVEDYCSVTPLGVFFNNLSNMFLTDIRYGDSKPAWFITLFSGIVLETYGYGILVAVDSKNREALFDASLPSPADMFFVSELPTKFLVAMLAGRTPDKDYNELFTQEKVKTALHKENVKLLSSILQKHRKMVRLYEEYRSRNKLDDSKYLGLIISLLSTETTYIFKDIAQVNPSMRLSNICSVLESSYINIDTMCHTVFNNAFDYITMLHEPQLNALYYRNLYAKEQGIDFITTHRSNLFLLQSEDLTEYRFFVREYHDIDKDIHLLLIDCQTDDADCFIPIDMKDCKSEFLVPSSFYVHMASLVVFKWLGVNDKVFPVDEREIAKKLLASLKQRNGDSCGIDEILQGVEEYVGLIQCINRDLNDLTDISNICYNQPIAWNYEHNQSNKQQSKGHSPADFAQATITVGRYTRKLPAGYKASEEAKALAAKYFISLEDGKTLVDSFDRRAKTKRLKLGE